MQVVRLQHTRNPNHVKEELRDGVEYVYDGDNIEVHAVPAGSEAQIGHFVVDPTTRGRGLGSTVMNALLDVLRGDGFTSVRARIAVADDPGPSDPTVTFLREHGFTDTRVHEDPDRGWLVYASRPLTPDADSNTTHD